MMPPRYDLVAVGRPYTDIIVTAPDDGLLREFALPVGQMREISPTKMAALCARLTGYKRFPGGSPSNTCAVVQALGGRAAFMGKVCSDAGGRQFRDAFVDSGVHFPTADYLEKRDQQRESITGAFVGIKTPPDNLTMVSCPGVGDELTLADMDTATIEAANMLYLQAHLLFASTSSDAILSGIEVARRAGRQVAMSLHDHRMNADQAATFRRRHQQSADILVGNRGEFEQIYGSQNAMRVRAGKQLWIVTDGARGAHILGGGDDLHIRAQAPSRIENPVGAGDAWFGAFSLAYGAGASLQLCGDFAARVASEILKLTGARPTSSWKSLADEYLNGVRALQN